MVVISIFMSAVCHIDKDSVEETLLFNLIYFLRDRRWRRAAAKCDVLRVVQLLFLTPSYFHVSFNLDR